MTRRAIPGALLAALMAATARADPPPGVLDLLRAAAEALADKDSAAFLDLFDRAMPGYTELRDNIEALLAADDVASTIEIANDEGTEQAREMELDWLLQISHNPPRRAVLKCRVERKGRSWKITGLEPIAFFRR
jgi:hypothetical protein